MASGNNDTTPLPFKITLPSLPSQQKSNINKKKSAKKKHKNNVQGACGNDNPAESENIVSSEERVVLQSFRCSVCQENFQNKGHLSHHEKVCKKPNSKSFFIGNDIDHRRRSADEEKIVPQDSQDENNHVQGEAVNDNCGICNLGVRGNAHALLCEQCRRWFHQRCMKMNPTEYQHWTNSESKWSCKKCLGIEVEAPNLKWGNMKGFQEIHEKVMQTYSEIIKWRKNMFEVPKGNIGKDVISEVTKIIQLFASKSKWEALALNLLNVFLPLMLQKPSRKSKTKDHIRYLEKRLGLWKEGRLDDLVSEGKEIQR